MSTQCERRSEATDSMTQAEETNQKIAQITFRDATNLLFFVEKTIKLRSRVILLITRRLREVLESKMRELGRRLQAEVS